MYTDACLVVESDATVLLGNSEGSEGETDRSA
jgi:hypothetical protein